MCLRRIHVSRLESPLSTGPLEGGAHFSALLGEVVSRHRPTVIPHHEDQGPMLLLAADDAREIFLSAAATPLEVVFEEGEVVITATALGLIGEGPDVPSALGALGNEIEAFATEYFDHFEHYRGTPDRAHARFLLRFLLTPTSDRAELLLESLRRGEMGVISDRPAAP